MAIEPALQPSALGCVRQAPELERRNDTPGRDRQHHLAGYVRGTLAAVARIGFAA
ncbi:MAG: hypothetical protein OXC94_02785 [Chloroflexi bacterium]|nr:hypothetical protein [Chloroflexota bacterium]